MNIKYVPEQILHQPGWRSREASQWPACPCRSGWIGRWKGRGSALGRQQQRSSSQTSLGCHRRGLKKATLQDLSEKSPGLWLTRCGGDDRGQGECCQELVHLEWVTLGRRREVQGSRWRWLSPFRVSSKTGHVRKDAGSKMSPLSLTRHDLISSDLTTWSRNWIFLYELDYKYYIFLSIISSL